jgi:gamma-glutamyl:cysteine ligase YbdK (ATP-grasp superfamily)
MAKKLHLFEGFGIECEYMLVDRSTLKVKPLAPKILEQLAGKPAMQVAEGETAWSNELVKHVLELKGNGPKSDLKKLHDEFYAATKRLNKILAADNAMLLGTAMHPLFVPEKETELWDSEDAEIYATYNRIFNCQGHGWSNLQSVHINFPFADDNEFGKLHAAIRVVLPILPALAASSPLCEGKYGPLNDTRLSFYLQNQRRIPEILGHAIPEAVFTQADYEKHILEPMYRAIAPHDPEENLQGEWLNSRAAIARFERSAIEIRLLDIQECLKADFAIVGLVTETVRALTTGSWSDKNHQAQFSAPELRRILDDVLARGHTATISDTRFLRSFGIEKSAATVREVWQHLAKTLNAEDSIALILDKGTLADRIKRRLGPTPTISAIQSTYLELAKCLDADHLFDP